MESDLSLKMLAVFALVLLVSSVNAGRVLTKCELKAHLDAARFQVIPDNMTVEDLVARLVCKASRSAFKTDSVKLVTNNHQEDYTHQSSLEDSPRALLQVTPQVPYHGPHNGTHQGPPTQRPPQGPPHGAHNGTRQGPPTQRRPQGPPHGTSNGTHKEPMSQVPPQGPPQGPPNVPPQGPYNRPRQGPPRKRFAPQEQQPFAPEHLYGVFQLSDQEACDSGMVPSRNVCQMKCTALIDDDIMDDIACLRTLVNSVKPKTKEQHPDNPHVFNLEECRDVVPSMYFAECM